MANDTTGYDLVDSYAEGGVLYDVWVHPNDVDDIPEDTDARELEEMKGIRTRVKQLSTESNPQLDEDNLDASI